MSDFQDPSRSHGLTTSCHLIPFDPGVYTIGLVLGTHDTGSGLPAARVTVPPGPAGRRETVSISAFRADGWVTAQDSPTLIRVIQERTPVLITLYWLAATGQTGAPNLQITRLTTEPEQTSQPRPASPFSEPRPVFAPAPVAPPSPAPAPARREAEIVAHVQDRGDIEGRIGDWIGTRGGGRAIEGYSLTPRLGLMPEDVEYRAVIAPDRLSPWLPGGQFCGSRGLGLPLLGFCVRLRGTAASRYDLACFARFVDGTEVGPIAADQVCTAESLAPMEAFQIVLRPRGF